MDSQRHAEKKFPSEFRGVQFPLTRTTRPRADSRFAGRTTGARHFRSICQTTHERYRNVASNYELTTESDTRFLMEPFIDEPGYGVLPFPRNRAVSLPILTNFLKKNRRVSEIEPKKNCLTERISTDRRVAVASQRQTSL